MVLRALLFVFVQCVCLWLELQSGVSDLQGVGAIFAHQIVPSFEAGQADNLAAPERSG